jgi:hypothetical protein
MLDQGGPLDWGPQPGDLAPCQHWGRGWRPPPPPGPGWRQGTKKQSHNLHGQAHHRALKVPMPDPAPQAQHDRAAGRWGPRARAPQGGGCLSLAPVAANWVSTLEPKPYPGCPWDTHGHGPGREGPSGGPCRGLRLRLRAGTRGPGCASRVVGARTRRGRRAFPAHVRGWAPPTRRGRRSPDPASPPRAAQVRRHTHRALGRQVAQVLDGADVENVDAAVLGRQRRVLLVDPHRGRVFAGTAGRRALPIHGPGGLCKRRRAGRVGGALALSRSLTRSLCRSQGAGPSRAPAAGDVVTSRSARRPRPRARAAHRAGCARASPSPPAPPPGPPRRHLAAQSPGRPAPGRELGRPPGPFP